MTEREALALAKNHLASDLERAERIIGVTHAQLTEANQEYSEMRRECLANGHEIGTRPFECLSCMRAQDAAH